MEVFVMELLLLLLLLLFFKLFVVFHQLHEQLICSVIEKMNISD